MERGMAGTLVGPREFAARRRRLMQALGPGSAAVFVAGSDSRRNGDVDHPFSRAEKRSPAKAGNVDHSVPLDSFSFTVRHAVGDGVSGPTACHDAT